MMRWHFNWKLSLFVLIFLPLTLRAGFWQLHRAQEKKAIIAKHEALVNEPAIDFLALKPEQLQKYRNVTATGTLLPKTFLLDNQIYQGHVGYEVIQALDLDHSNRIIFISRGWVEGNPDRRILPIIETLNKHITVTGYLYEPKPVPQLKNIKLAEGWPKVVQTVNLENFYNALADSAKMRRALRADGIKPPAHSPFVIRLNANSIEAFKSHWVIVSMPPERHSAYAAQWFGMAALLVVLFIFASLTKDESGVEKVESCEDI